MPLLQKRPFKPRSPPKELTPDEEVFVVPLTNEIFREYDEFFERTILLNSMLWTCTVTGKTGLTYEEALESEKKAQENLDSFPEFLERPLLYTVTLTCRGRLDDLVSDIWLLMKDRYFIGEICETSFNGKRRLVKVISVCCIGGESPEMVEISSGRRLKESLIVSRPDDFSYEIRILDAESQEIEGSCDPMTVLHSNLTRIKTANKARIKLFLKNAGCVDGDKWTVKPKLMGDFGLTDLEWTDIFGGPLPIFPRVPLQYRKRERAETPELDPSDLFGDGQSTKKPKKTEKKRKLTKEERQAERKERKEKEKQARKEQKEKERKEKKEQLEKKKKKTGTSKAELARQAEERKRNERKAKQIEAQQKELATLFLQVERYSVDISSLKQTNRLVRPEEIIQLRDALKRAKEEEKEKLKEEKRKERELLLEWRKPRDDLLCDDLKPLPPLSKLNFAGWLSQDLFAGCLQIVEFCHSFKDQLPIRDHFEDGAVSLETVFDALTTDKLDGTLTDLFSLLLQAKAQRGDEEDGDEANLRNKEELSAENCDLDHRVYGPIIRDATLLHEKIRNVHGESVRHLPTDGATLTEVLRLHVRTSAYYGGSAVAWFRYSNRGNYRCWDDPALAFRIDPHGEALLDKLETMSLLELRPCDRLQLLRLLCDQLLTSYRFREKLEERTEKLRTVRNDIRQLRAWDQSRDKEAANAKALLKQIDVISRQVEEMKSAEITAEVPTVPERPKPSKQTERLKRWILAFTEGGPALRRFEGQQEELLGSVAFDELEPSEMDAVRRIQKESLADQERQLLRQAFYLHSQCGMQQLGRDRAFRRYYLLADNVAASLPSALLVEAEHVPCAGPCLEATPLNKVSSRPGDDDVPLLFDREKADRELRNELFACTGETENDGVCPIHTDPLADPLALTSSVPSQWYCVDSQSALNQFLDALNPRGFREAELLENVGFLRERIEKSIADSERTELLGADCEWLEEVADNATDRLRARVREMILEIEEKVHDGGLGRLKVSDREVWRRSFTEGRLALQVTEVCLDGQIVYSPEEVERLSTDSQLAVALLQVAQGIRTRFLQLPFAAAPMAIDDETGEEIEIEGQNALTEMFGNWQRSLIESRNCSQLALHLRSLEPGVAWAKSKLQSKCRECRRRGDAQTILLCSACDRAYHTFCCRPPMKELPSEDKEDVWKCAECNAAEIAAIKKQNRLSNQMAKRLKEQTKNDSPKAHDGLTNGDLYDNGIATDDRNGGGSGRNSSRTSRRSSPMALPENDYNVVTTSSGRRVKKREHYEAELIPPSTSKQHRQPSNTNGSAALRRVSTRVRRQPINNHNGAMSDENSITEDDDTDSWDTPPPAKRRRNGAAVGLSSGNSETTLLARSLSVGVRARPDAKLVEQMSFCEQLIRRAMRHQDAWPFLAPVNAKEAPYYYDVIERPMDLGTMLNNLKNRRYDTPTDVHNDARLMFSNCRAYNEDESEVSQCGRSLEKYMNEQFQEMDICSPPPLLSPPCSLSTDGAAASSSPHHSSPPPFSLL